MSILWEFHRYLQARRDAIQALGLTERDGYIYSERGLKDFRPSTHKAIKNVTQLLLEARRHTKKGESR